MLVLPACCDKWRERYIIFWKCTLGGELNALFFYFIKNSLNVGKVGKLYRIQRILLVEFQDLEWEEKNIFNDTFLVWKPVNMKKLIADYSF